MCCRSCRRRCVDADCDWYLSYDTIDILQELNSYMSKVWCGNPEAWNALKGFADTSHPLAAAMVAVCFSHRQIRIVPNNAENARIYANLSMQWLAEEASSGCMYAQYYLAEFHDKAITIPENKAEAIRLCRLAADQELDEAQATLGYWFGLDNDVATVRPQQIRLYRLAADQGNARALNSLGYCYDFGEDVAQDYVEAAHLYRLGAEQGLSYAQYALGLCLKGGKGIPQNITEAVHYLGLAADQNFAYAQCSLGLHYLSGEGVDKDLAQAKHWFELASAQGSKEAQVQLAALK
jgi:TPR repeat protein